MSVITKIQPLGSSTIYELNATYVGGISAPTVLNAGTISTYGTQIRTTIGNGAYTCITVPYATTASQLANSLTFAGAISAVYNGSSPCTITTSSLSVCDTSLIGITSCISSSTSTNIPTEGAVYGFASQGCTIKVTSAVDGVTYPFTGVSSISSTSQGSLYYNTKAYLLSGFLYSNGLKVDPDTQYPIIIDYTI